MFRDDPSVTVPGKYYFAPDNTPFYSGVNNLWSRNWLDSNNKLTVTIGERLGVKQTWNRGDPPAVLPLNRPVGSLQCLAEGDLVDEGISGEEIINGLPAACFLPVNEDWQRLAAWESCSMQLFYARVLYWMYLADVTSIGTAFNLLIGPVSTITYHPGSGLVPDILTCITPSAAVLIVDGTANFEQFASQAFLAILPPMNFGTFSTSLLWFNTSTYALSVLTADGYTVDKPIICVGHSYGGVVASLASARIRQGNPDLDIRLLTFGDPKPGDERLKAVLDTIPGLSLVNDDDLITAIPPDFLTLLPVMLALADPGLAVWSSWIREPNRVMMDLDGILYPNATPTLDYPTLFVFAQRAIANQELDAVTPHWIGEYIRRIIVRCNLTEWPVSTTLYTFLGGPAPQPTSAVFTSAGPHTFTVPNGVTSITVNLKGAGAIGSPGPIGGVGVGGGGGASSITTITVVPGTVYNIFVGYGSLGVPATNGITWFDSPATLKADCGGHRSLPVNSVPGLASRSLGSAIFDGGYGGGTLGVIAGGGGSSAGDSVRGNPIAPAVHSAGGVAPAGGGDGGDGLPAGSTPTPVMNGHRPGGGGAGQVWPFAIANGGDGSCIISW